MHILLVSLLFISPKILDSVFTKGDTLLYKGYEVTRSYDSQTGAWFATLKKGGKVLALFKKGGYLKRMTSFGLFPFLGRETRELIIEQYSGGAHCCWTYWIFNLLPEYEIIYDSEEYPVGYGLTPIDLDKDGVFEFTQTILTFDYFDRLCHALSPLPAVVFKYDRRLNKYLPANHLFSDYLLKGIGEDIERVNKLNEKIDFKSYSDERGEYLSAILEVVLRYIYAGKEREAWSFYETEYKLPDKEEVKTKIKEKLESCSIYKYTYSH